MTQCAWSIRRGAGLESVSRCRKDEHVRSLQVTPLPDGRSSVGYEGDGEHEGPGLAEFPDQKITWHAGDRREWEGGYPGPCPHQPCTLHDGHHGRHAP